MTTLSKGNLPGPVSGYAQGARIGASQVEQITERYRLWANLGQVVEKKVNAHRSRPARSPPEPAGTPDELPVVQPTTELKIVIRLREQHPAAHELREQATSKAATGSGPTPRTCGRRCRQLHGLQVRDRGMDRLTGHVSRLATMMTGLHGDRLEDWIADAKHEELAPLAGFARTPPRLQLSPQRPISTA
ncbi:hypothetical protein [Streptomyces sp. 058-1L]|uniref:hypothetical protein n=1 Tax=Streptomyces sp. 058-1L TaxID=2789266 RepID=UPI003980624C